MTQELQHIDEPEPESEPEPNAFPPLTNRTIREAVQAFCDEGGGRQRADFLHSPQAQAKYGPVSAWDVSAVTSMEELFYDCEAFNQPIGAWKVDQVTNMRYMFDGAAALASKPLWYRE